MNFLRLSKSGLTGLFCVLVSNAFLTGCAGVFSKEFKMTEVPVNARSFSRPIDDESLEYLVSFKNVGQEIVTFDYTLADIPKVPHVDAGGPNSGLIENLYPGAQVEIKNPFKTTNIYISMGKVVVGKLTPEAVKARYNFSNAPAPLIPTLDIPSI